MTSEQHMDIISKFPRPWARLLDNMGTAVLWLDGAGNILHANQAAEMLFEQSARHMLGEQPANLLVESNGLAQHIATAINHGQATAEWESTFVTRNGNSLTVDYAVTAMRGEGGNDVLIEARRVDRHLAISRNESRQAQQNVSRELIRGLAHEIKNPLGGLRGAAQLLEMELADPALQEYTQVIVREADRLRGVVDRLLGPNQRVDLQPVNIHRVVERVRQLIEVEAGESIKVERDYDPSIPEINADTDLLIQAVLNIARNAMQALRESAEQQQTDIIPQLSFRTRAARKVAIGNRVIPSALRLDITDNGPGIPAELIEQVFYPMVTGRADGTGLGLAIAQTIVSQHGGEISCRSEPGKTRFTIYIPFTPEN